MGSRLIDRLGAAPLVRADVAAPPNGAHDLGRARSRGVRSTPVAAQFDALLPFERWSELGARLGLYANATPWWLGDWLVFGKMKYGRRYKQAIWATGLEYQTLRNYAVVARRYDVSRRRDNLTFQHHAELCALSDLEQDRWLDLSQANAWSRKELRRQRNGERALQPGSGSGVVTLAFDVEQVRRWREAAQRADADFSRRVAQALDEAASQE